MKTVCVIPIYERQAITLATLELFKNQTLPLHEIIVVGSTPNDKLTASKAGVTYVQAPNKPLSNKVQCGIDEARKRNPDAILTSGSDSWPTSNFYETLSRYVEEGADLVGKIHSYSCKANPGEALEVLSHSYICRKDPIGGGRILSRKALEALNWKVYKPGMNQSLDSSSYRILTQGIKGIKIVIADKDLDAFSMDIKSTNWKNITKFATIKRATKELRIETVALPEKWLEVNYPGSLATLKNVVPGIKIIGD
jgi:glycosyltransferase involved in cell wall biosynthesis